MEIGPVYPAFSRFLRLEDSVFFAFGLCLLACFCFWFLRREQNAPRPVSRIFGTLDAFGSFQLRSTGRLVHATFFFRFVGLVFFAFGLCLLACFWFWFLRREQNAPRLVGRFFGTLGAFGSFHARSTGRLVHATYGFTLVSLPVLVCVWVPWLPPVLRPGSLLPRSCR